VKQHKNLLTKANYLIFLFIALQLAACGAPPEFRESSTLEPTQWKPTQWKPIGSRFASVENEVLGKRTAFKALHGDALNSDEVTSALSPMFEADWVSETRFFIPEGPTFDDDGNIYFSPLMPHEKVALISIEPDTGQRRWAVSGEFLGLGGAPLVLDNPDTLNTPNTQIIYTGGYEKIIAVRTDGSLVWEANTGLKYTGETRFPPHNFGLNYHPQTDSLIAIMQDGHLVALNRKTGTLRFPPFKLPGEPARDNKTAGLLPGFLIERVDSFLSPLIDMGENSSFREILNVLLGGSAVVANYFSIDPNSGFIWLTSTAPDSADGVEDGVSEFGSLNAFKLTQDEDGFKLEQHCSFNLEGGSASTPALRADGKRVYIGDAVGNLIALNTECKPLWSLYMGGQISGSVAVSSDNREIYVSGLTFMKKVIDQGEFGEIRWEADINSAFASLPIGMAATNLNGATIGANGIMMLVGAGYKVADVILPIVVGMAFIDRESGKVRFASEGLEGTVSAMSSGPDGAFYLGHSPVRHTISAAILPQVTGVIGGIGKYRPKQLQLLAHEAFCSSIDRIENRVLNWNNSSPNEIRADMNQARHLLDQAAKTVIKAISNEELDSVVGENILKNIKAVEAQVNQNNPADIDLKTAAAFCL
jgi:outer membrane protein assembly factor BamB